MLTNYYDRIGPRGDLQHVNTRLDEQKEAVGYVMGSLSDDGVIDDGEYFIGKTDSLNKKNVKSFDIINVSDNYRVWMKKIVLKIENYFSINSFSIILLKHSIAETA